jgi:hypothetical protein
VKMSEWMFPGTEGTERMGAGTRAQAGSPYLVDAELALEAAAGPIVQRNLHGVVNVAYLVSAHLILYVQPDHCGSQGEQSVTHIRRDGTGRGRPVPTGAPMPCTPAQGLGSKITDTKSASRGEQCPKPSHFPRKATEPWPCQWLDSKRGKTGGSSGNGARDQHCRGSDC